MSWLWFTTVENCQIYDCDKPFTVATKYSHVVLRSCFIDNSRDHPYPVILSVPHCTVVDSEIDAGIGSVCVGLGDLSPARVVFSMQRCLIRTHSGWVGGSWMTGAPPPRCVGWWMWRMATARRIRAAARTGLPWRRHAPERPRSGPTSVGLIGPSWVWMSRTRSTSSRSEGVRFTGYLVGPHPRRRGTDDPG